MMVVPVFLLFLYIFHKETYILVTSTLSFVSLSFINIVYYNIYEVYIEDRLIVYENLYTKKCIDVDLFEKVVEIYPPFFRFRFKDGRNFVFLFTSALPFGNMLRKESYTESLRQRIEEES